MPANQLKQRLLDVLPYRPYCAKELRQGTMIRPVDQALECPFIQINPPHLVRYLSFDVDRSQAALSFEDAGLPPPTWIATNPKNGHAHLVYELSSPVYRGVNAAPKPLVFLRVIQEAMEKALGADAGYVGLLTKNPLHPRWRLWQPAGHPTYSLSELEDWVQTGPRRPRRLGKQIGLPLRETTREGHRNTETFRRLSDWAYRQVHHSHRLTHWHARVRRMAVELNMFNSPALPESEIRTTATSVARWCWDHRRDAALALSNRQRERGILSGIARRKRIADSSRSCYVLRTLGGTVEYLQSRFKRSRRSIYYWIAEHKKNRPRVLLSEILYMSQPLSTTDLSATSHNQITVKELSSNRVSEHSPIEQNGALDFVGHPTKFRYSCLLSDKGSGCRKVRLR